MQNKATNKDTKGRYRTQIFFPFSPLLVVLPQPRLLFKCANNSPLPSIDYISLTKSFEGHRPTSWSSLSAPAVHGCIGEGGPQL